ncbi:MAG: cytochrome c biogenesis protein CcsA [Candidatus Aminicenantes bacterium]|nr:cytochrome c biogenesis protein CcsA [Candidatus Aminicenantes bacterium]NLH77843.1 cytochrome c biogenesis protein CcsA [Acidobacteriota bacterium]
MTEPTLFTAAFVLYVASLVVYFASLFARREKWAKAAFVLAVAGFAGHTAALVIRTFASGHAPFTNMYESLSFLSWSVVLAVILFGRTPRVPRLAPYLMLIAVALVALASSPLMPKDATPLVPALQSYWLWLHVSVTLLGEAFFAVAFVAALLYLFAEEGEKRDRLDALAYRAVAVGFPLFTLGGLVFGMVWAYRAWGRYWGWDPKEVWSLITWFVFALYLHTRIVMGWKGKRSAWIAIIGFLAALFTYFGVNYILSGLHSYA